MLLQLCSCIIEVREWCSSRRLQLNDAKTELIWFGSRANLSKLTSSDCSLLVGGDIIKPSTTVRDLGVLLDSELSLKQHVNKVVSSCWYHIRRLRQVSHCIGQDVMKQLASAFILFRLDYCNSILAGLPKSTIATLQRVQNAAARMVLNLRPRDCISDGLRQLHWLPIESRIQFKLCLMMHLIHTGRCPSYISETVQLVADHSSPEQSYLSSFRFNCKVHSTKTAYSLWGARLLVLWPEGMECASRSISFHRINRLF